MDEKPMFRIEYISQQAPSYFFARQLNQVTWTPGERLILGGIHVLLGFQPRAKTPQGEPDLTVFAFRPLKKTDLAQLAVGQVVGLE